MQKTLTAVAALAAVFVAAPAFAQPAEPTSSNYVQGNVGLGFGGNVDIDVISSEGAFHNSETLSEDIFVSGAVGHAFSNGVAVEVEGIYTHNRISEIPVGGGFSDANTYTWGVLANLKYEVPVNWHGIAPYIGGGVGYGDIHAALENQSGDNDGGFIWQGKAGLLYHVNDRLAFDLGYRYIGQPDAKTTFPDGVGGFDTIKLSSHENVVSLGARWNF